MKLCECGCGEPAPLAKQTNRRWGHVKGQPMRFVYGHTLRIYHGRSRRGQTHGHTVGKRTPEYISWSAMKQRCLYPNHVAYEEYGGRGIMITDRWLGRDGFVNFLTDMGERPEGTSLDRIDVDGNYEPENVRWATSKEQTAPGRRRRAA